MVQASAREFPRQDQLVHAISIGTENLIRLQGKDGAWRGDYGGPMFLLPMYISACYITGQPIPPEKRVSIIAYLCHAQNEDESVGLHLEAPGYLFTTVLCYVALRLLDVSPDDPSAARMRHWIHAHGTPLGCASWGKFFLALLNLYDYDGLHPVLPELWLLPDATPFHPGKLWCHCRQVYLPMAYLYSMRAKIPENELVKQLRLELYPQTYDQIRFGEHRDTVASTDSYVPTSTLLHLVNRMTDSYEKVHPGLLRKRSLAALLDHIEFEDRVTNFIRIGPVNAVLNTLVHHFNQPKSEAVRRSVAALEEYLWEGHDGIKMNGYNSTALWDTAFAVQAILATPFAHQHVDALLHAHDYVRDNQMVEDLPGQERHYRHTVRGGWPFSDRLNGWPTTDCTSEGLKCALALEKMVEQPVPEELLRASIRLILSMQNRDGGWASYEKQRGGRWLERLNPSQVFADIMVDYSYVECTSACIQALVRARQRFPNQLDEQIGRAVHRGERFIRQQQRPDGSWEGSWGVCFTYGTWFGVWGLVAAGAPSEDPAIQRACRFLQDHQNADGGWGEHYTSCTERQYVPHRESQVVNTAWALLTLTRAGQADSEAARKGARFLIERQQEDGDWPRQSLCGVFNKSVHINYENYRRYFPVWALASYASSRNADRGIRSAV